MTPLIYIPRNGNTVDFIISIMNKLSDEERYKVIQHYCKHCGSKDTSCQCWNDE